MREVTMSEKPLSASSMMDLELINSPTTSFAAERSRFITIPAILYRMMTSFRELVVTCKVFPPDILFCEERGAFYQGFPDIPTSVRRILWDPLFVLVHGPSGIENRTCNRPAKVRCLNGKRHFRLFG
jgi:hypothetical protein